MDEASRTLAFSIFVLAVAVGGCGFTTDGVPPPPGGDDGGPPTNDAGIDASRDDAGADARAPDAAATDGAADALADAPPANDAPSEAGSLSYRDEVFADNPLAYWRLDESSGTTANDVTGHGYTGTYAGGFTLGAAGALRSDPDTAASFDGTSGYVTVGNQFAFTGKATMSAEAWVKPIRIDSMNHGVMGRLDSGHVGWNLIVNNGGSVEFQRWEGTNGNAKDSVSGPVATGTYTHVVVTYDGATLRLYMNGGLMTSVTSNAMVSAGGVPFELAEIGRSGGNSFIGAVDEAAIYDHALSAGRVLAHYAAGIR